MPSGGDVVVPGPFIVAGCPGYVAEGGERRRIGAEWRSCGVGTKRRVSVVCLSVRCACVCEGATSAAYLKREKGALCRVRLLNHLPVLCSSQLECPLQGEAPVLPAAAPRSGGPSGIHSLCCLSPLPPEPIQPTCLPLPSGGRPEDEWPRHDGPECERRSPSASLFSMGQINRRTGAPCGSDKYHRITSMSLEACSKKREGETARLGP